MSSRRPREWHGRTRILAGADEIPVVDPIELDPTEPVSGLPVRTPFRLDGYRLELLAVGGESGWHRRDGPVDA